jgi:hypothetical protein
MFVHAHRDCTQNDRSAGADEWVVDSAYKDSHDLPLNVDGARRSAEIGMLNAICLGSVTSDLRFAQVIVVRVLDVVKAISRRKRKGHQIFLLSRLHGGAWPSCSSWVAESAASSHRG